MNRTRAPRPADDLWGNLSWHSRVQITAAIFFTFATIGIIQDMWQVDLQRSWPLVLAMLLMSGLIAISFAFTFMRSYKFALLIPVTMGAQILLSSVEAGIPLVLPEGVTRRLTIEGVLLIVLIAIGYTCFIVFISTEGTRQLRLRTEIDLARRIHETLVPPIEYVGDHIEVYGHSSPSDEIGGDLLDVFTQDERSVVTIADVSGHGVSAGTLMGMVKSAMRMRFLNSGSLGTIVNDLNRIVFKVKSEAMFVTFACMEFSGGERLECALAGHLPILHVRTMSGNIERISSKQVPLGVVEGDVFEAERVDYAHGDLFVLLTDGLTEVVDGRDQEFGEEGIESIIRDQRDRSLSEIHHAIMTAVAGHGRQQDDQTLVLVRVR